MCTAHSLTAPVLDWTLQIQLASPGRPTMYPCSLAAKKPAELLSIRAGDCAISFVFSAGRPEPPLASDWKTRCPGPNRLAEASAAVNLVLESADGVAGV